MLVLCLLRVPFSFSLPTTFSLHAFLSMAEACFFQVISFVLQLSKIWTPERETGFTALGTMAALPLLCKLHLFPVCTMPTVGIFCFAPFQNPRKAEQLGLKWEAALFAGKYINKYLKT